MYLDNLLNIDNKYSGLISQIYPSELQLNKPNSSENDAPFLHLFILDGFTSCKSYDNCINFNFEKVNFPYLEWDSPHRASNDVYISQPIRFTRVSSHVTDFNTQNKLLTAKLLNQGFWYINSAKPFLNFVDVISV